MKQKYFVAFGIILFISTLFCIVVGLTVDMAIYDIGCLIALFLLVYNFYMPKMLMFLFKEKMTRRLENIVFKISLSIAIIFSVMTIVLMVGLIINIFG